jgi:hypothetical protein
MGTRSRIGDVVASASPEARLAAAAVVAIVAFRAGVLPGGQLGYDLLLGLAAHRMVRLVRSGSSVRSVVTRTFSAAWPGAIAAILLAVVWVLLTPSTRWDATVRGEALGIVGGYGNWHQLARGPAEAGWPPVHTPLQGVWAWSVLVQIGAVWAVVWTAVLGIARRRVRLGRSGNSGILAFRLSSVVGELHVVAAAVTIALASAPTVALSTVTRGLGFSVAMLAAAFVMRHPDHAVLRWARRAGPGPLVVFAVAVLAVRSTGAVDLRVGLVVVALVVVAAVLGATAPAPAPADVDRPVETAAVTVVWLAGPAFAIARGSDLGLPWPLGVVTGLVLLGVATAGVLDLARRRGGDARAVERRRVLGPAAVVVALILVASVTGAFRWQAPTTTLEWRCTNGRSVPSDRCP